jgi:hypothetical protein
MPKSKKKEEEESASFSTFAKKEEITEITEINGINNNCQKRISTGGSSESESVSSFSQESSPNRISRSPQQTRQPPSMLSSLVSTEPQLRGAGFYQDVLSSGSSPYNSPYYTTPPHYSALLPPRPSSQNHPISPAYPSLVNFDRSVVPMLPCLYSQTSLKGTSQAHSPTFMEQLTSNCLLQNSSQNKTQLSYTTSTIATTQNQSTGYPRQVRR